jgi:hypothetical protein
MEDVVKSICCNAHGEVFVGKKRTRKGAAGKTDVEPEEKKNSGNVGTTQANQKEQFIQLMYKRRSEERRQISLRKTVEKRVRLRRKKKRS